MKYKPLHNRVIVKIDPKQENIDGLYTPEYEQDQRITGTVIAVGPGIYEEGVLMPMAVVVGEHVLFGKYNGTHLEGEEDCILMRDVDIYCTIED